MKDRNRICVILMKRKGTLASLKWIGITDSIFLAGCYISFDMVFVDMQNFNSFIMLYLSLFCSHIVISLNGPVSAAYNMCCRISTPVSSTGKMQMWRSGTLSPSRTKTSNCLIGCRRSCKLVGSSVVAFGNICMAQAAGMQKNVIGCWWHLNGLCKFETKAEHSYLQVPVKLTPWWSCSLSSLLGLSKSIQWVLYL